MKQNILAIAAIAIVIVIPFGVWEKVGTVILILIAIWYFFGDKIEEHDRQAKEEKQRKEKEEMDAFIKKQADKSNRIENWDTKDYD